MVFAAAIPTRKPVNEPGPLMTITFLRSSYLSLCFFISSSIAGISFSASSFSLCQDFSPKTFSSLTRAIAVFLDAVLIAIVTINLLLQCLCSNN